MIYKIQGEFSDDEFENMLTKLSKYFIFMYFDNSLYLALLNYNFKGDPIKTIERCIKPITNFYIMKLTSKNINAQPNPIKDWAFEQINRLKLQKINIEHQESLNNMWGILDDIENSLKESQNNT